MYYYSSSSIEKLNTCDKDLQILFKYVILFFDCTIVYGHRSEVEQFELYKKGRSFVNGSWKITDKEKVVTNIDGVNSMSTHNYYPSLAVDAAPYPTLYKSEITARHFAGFVLGVAKTLKYLGYINNEIISGVDWDNDNDLYDQNFNDMLHFQILKKTI